MTKVASLFALSGPLFMLGLPLTSAQAQATRTFVSGQGDDGNACSRTAPCRTFAGAIGKTNAGGEIDVLDPAGYGAVTITKSISIVDDGVGEAGVQGGSGATAITINAGSSDVIHLRGLTLEGAGLAARGIQLNTGSSLTVANCVVRNFTDTAIYLAPNNPLVFFISDTLVADNALASGIYIGPIGTTIKGVIDNVEAVNSGSALSIDASQTNGVVDVTIVDSVFNRNQYYALYAYTSSGHSTPTVRLGNSVITENAAGVYGANLVASYGDNKIDGNNGNDVSGTMASVSKR